MSTHTPAHMNPSFRDEISQAHYELNGVYLDDDILDSVETAISNTRDLEHVLDKVVTMYEDDLLSYRALQSVLTALEARNPRRFKEGF